MTAREALAEGAAALAAAGIASAGLDASLLLAEALGISRTRLIAAGPEPLAEEPLAAFRDFIKRRQGGECAAYILGRKEFYGLEFTVNPSVLIPRPDTETLVEAAVAQLTMSRERLASTGQPLRALDLCTGSGAVAIALKHKLPELEMWATDISAAALTTAEANAARLLPPGSIRFCQGNLFEALSATRYPLPTTHYLLPLIVSNPPYIPSAEIADLSAEVRAEPVLALDGGSDGLCIIREIISHAPEFLPPGGALLLEADPRQMGKIAALLEKSGFTRIQTYKDLSGGDRVISGEKK